MSRRMRVLVVGDSVAGSLGELLATWSKTNPALEVTTRIRTGCGLIRGGEVRTAFGEVVNKPACAKWATDWPDILEQVRPDAVVLSSSFWDATDRRFGDDSVWRQPGDPIYDSSWRSEYEHALDLLSAHDTPVLWLDHPPIWSNEKTWARPTNLQIFDARRMAHLDALQTEIAASRPLVRVVATTPYLEASPGGVFDASVRPDGLHFVAPGADPFISWLGPELVAAYWTVRASR